MTSGKTELHGASHFAQRCVCRIAPRGVQSPARGPKCGPSRSRAVPVRSRCGWLDGASCPASVPSQGRSTAPTVSSVERLWASQACLGDGQCLPTVRARYPIAERARVAMRIWRSVISAAAVTLLACGSGTSVGGANIFGGSGDDGGGSASGSSGAPTSSTSGGGSSGSSTSSGSSGGFGSCIAQSCTGCCDSTGTCQAAQGDTVCGIGGVSCTDCTTVGQTCQSGTCSGGSSSSAARSSSGGSRASGSSSGSSGGYCAMNPAACGSSSGSGSSGSSASSSGSSGGSSSYCATHPGRVS